MANQLIYKRHQFPWADLYIWLQILYRLSGVLYPQGIINQAIQVALIAFGIIGSYKYLIPSRSSSVLFWTSTIIWMYVIYGTYNIFYPDLYAYFNPSKYDYLKTALNSLLPILLFYTFYKKGYITEAFLQKYTIILFFVFIAIFFKSEKEAIENFRGNYIKEEFTNNSGYTFLTLIPMILFIKRSIVRYMLLIGTMIFIFMAFKRGAIILGSFSLLYIFIRDIKRTKSRNKKIGVIMLGVFLFAYLSIYVTNLYNESAYFQERIESTLEGQMSGRDELAEKIILAIEYHTTELQLIFGHGANATIGAAGNLAHNDWLETIYNNGLIGVCILAMFYISMIVDIIIIRKRIDTTLKTVFILTVFICIAKTLFSMSIQDMSITQSLLVALLAYKSTKTTHYKYKKITLDYAN